MKESRSYSALYHLTSTLHINDTQLAFIRIAFYILVDIRMAKPVENFYNTLFEPNTG